MKPLSRLEPLTDDQRAQVAEWVLAESLRKTMDLAREHFAIEIPRMTLSRFRNRLLAERDLPDDSPNAPAAHRELIRHAATGQGNFTPATLLLLEQLAFDLALDCQHTDESLAPLTQVTAILCRHRNTANRERLAAVQERKCLLRQAEIKLNSKPPSTASALPNSMTTQHPRQRPLHLPPLPNYHQQIFNSQ